MNCVYYYKGHKFDSELELDNYLLGKRKFESKFGDAVFSLGESQMNYTTQLEDWRKNTKVAWDEYLHASKLGLIKRDEDGDPYIRITDEGKHLRYLGVNRFLEAQHKNGNINNKLLFPHFDVDKYFNERYVDWKQGVNFSKTEKELFFPDGNEQPIPADKCDDYRKLIEEKWDAQGRCGDIIHEVLQLFFSDTEINGNKVYIRDMNTTDRFNYIKQEISKSDKFKWLEFNGNPDDNIRSAINTALKIFDQIKAQTNCESNELVFFPEYLLTGVANDTVSKKDIDLFGLIDLLVVDKFGKFHIIDYKTSIKNYTDFDSAKVRGYSYQLAMYKQMLENQGFPVRDITLSIAPIKIEMFQKGQNGFQFNGVSFDKMDEITRSADSTIAFTQVEYFMPSKYLTTVGAENLFANTSKFSTDCFEIDNSYTNSPEYWKKRLNKQKVFEEKNDKGEYEYSIYNYEEKKYVTVTDSDEKGLIDKIIKVHENLKPKRINITNHIKSALKECIMQQNPDYADFPKVFSRAEGASTYMRNIISQYCNPEWEVQDMPDIEQLGVIMLYNKNTRQRDFIRVSTSDLTENYHKHLNEDDDKRKGRTKILSKFETDAQAEQKQKRLTLNGTYGNAELMELMMIINSMTGLDNDIIGNIQVINPSYGEMLTASNEQLLMNFSTLCKYTGHTDNFTQGKIKLASYFDLLLDHLNEIWTIQENLENPWKGEYRRIQQFTSCKSMLDTSKQGDVTDKIKAVERLISEMRAKFPELKSDITDLAQLKTDKVRLYSTALFALSELRGINFRQQTEDHDQWFSSVAKALSQGLSGNMIDNPGNLESDTLNLITSLVKEAFQNTRDEIQQVKAELDTIISKLKKDLGFNYLKENIGFNQAKLYEPLYRYIDVNGVKDIQFKTVKQLISEGHSEYVPLLEFVLKQINKRRFNLDDQLLDDKFSKSEPEYYQVPLAMGGKDSQVSSRGLLNMLKDKLRYLNPMNWKDLYEDTERAVQGLGYKEKRAKQRQNEALLYEMENMFDKGEGQGRLQAIDDAKGNRKNVDGVDFLEKNVETLLLKYVFAHAQQKHINGVFPLIQASMLHLSLQGANVGTKFRNDKSFLDKYIRNKIKNENIVDPNFQGATKIISMLRNAASKLTLALTPVQLFYQPLQGLWVDIRLIIQNKYNGQQTFTFHHFKNAVKLLAKDLFDFSGKPTLLSKINELYALNDMDINRYVDNITHNKKGLFYNMDNFMYKFASRPDYYNRLAIFLSQMQGDGCLEAHSIVDGKLKYNWTEDKRFSKFAANPKDKYNTDPEYIKQRALYYAVAQQFVNEGAVDENGKLFKLDMNDPQPLPKAYTSKQAEGYKSVADDIYGYYSNENKSLIQSTAFGAMWLQFKTFWSGKKNQYLQSGGVRMRGSWEPWVEIEKDTNGNPTGKKIEYYYAVDENGDINYNKVVKKDELPLSKQIAPVVQWRGQWQEGIAVTMAQLCQDRQILRNYRRMMNEDPSMAKCYRSNMIQLGYDLALWLIGGGIIGGLLAEWLKELLEENKDNDDFLTGCALTGANIAVWSVKNSFADFNMFESIGSPLVNWTPFALQFTTRTINNLGKYAVGDQDLWDTIVKTNGMMKQAKPLFDAIKPEEYRTKVEGGTWESRTTINNREQT